MMAASGVLADAAGARASAKPFFRTRGVVLVPEDLSLADWPERARRAGLTTIALHPTPSAVEPFVRSHAGQAFLARCKDLGIEVEYELHAMADLLPRALFDRNPDMFRCDEHGTRVRDANLCVHSTQALEIVAENAVRVGRALKPSTKRYFFWGDDGAPWCRCPKCRALTDSDQALLLENHLVKALRAVTPGASVAHLAYANTLRPPTSVKPAAGVFLEFAPINRRYDTPFAEQSGPEFPERLEHLDANLAVFPKSAAQVLEYWLDCSRFSGWRKPAVKVPWRADVFRADLDAYGKRGIRHITTFAVYIDADYVAQHGEPPLDEYGAGLRGWPTR